jgi:hypothetical protein
LQKGYLVARLWIPFLIRRAARMPSSQPIYIALDFDGVLHHEFAGPQKDDFLEQPFDAKKFLGTVAARNRDTNEKGWAKLLRRQSDILDVKRMYRVGALFDRAGHLEDILMSIPNPRILITTTWRNRIDLDQLKEVFPSSMRALIAGAIDRDPGNDQAPGIRGDLVTKWLESNGEPDAVWFALDDQSRHYENHPAHLLQTHYAGLDDHAFDRALDKLDELKALAEANYAAPSPSTKSGPSQAGM